MNDRRRERFQSAKVNYRRRLKPSSECPKSNERSPLANDSTQAKQTLIDRKSAVDRYVKQTETMDPFQLRTSSKPTNKPEPVLYSSMAPKPKHGISFQGSFQGKQALRQQIQSSTANPPTKQEDSLQTVSGSKHALPHDSRSKTNSNEDSAFGNSCDEAPLPYLSSTKQKIDSTRPKNGLRAGTLTRFQKNTDGILPEFDAKLLRQMDSDETEQIGNLKAKNDMKAKMQQSKTRGDMSGLKISSFERMPPTQQQFRLQDKSAIQNKVTFHEKVSRKATAVFPKNLSSAALNAETTSQSRKQAIQGHTSSSLHNPITKGQINRTTGLSFGGSVKNNETLKGPSRATSQNHNKATRESDSPAFKRESIERFHRRISGKEDSGSQVSPMSAGMSKEQFVKNSRHRKMRVNKAAKSKKVISKRGAERFTKEASHAMQIDYGLEASGSSGILASGEDETTNSESVSSYEARMRAAMATKKKMLKANPKSPHVARKDYQKKQRLQRRIPPPSPSSTKSNGAQTDTFPTKETIQFPPSTKLSSQGLTKKVNEHHFRQSQEDSKQMLLDAEYSTNLMDENEQRRIEPFSQDLKSSEENYSKELSKIQASPSQIEATRNILDDLSAIDFDAFVSDRKSAAKNDRKAIISKRGDGCIRRNNQDVIQSRSDQDSSSNHNTTVRAAEDAKSKNKKGSNSSLIFGQPDTKASDECAIPPEDAPLDSLIQYYEKHGTKDGLERSPDSQKVMPTNDTTMELETLVDKLINSADKLPTDNSTRAKQRKAIKRACRQLDARLKKEGLNIKSNSDQGHRRGLVLFKQLRRGRNKVALMTGSKRKEEGSSTTNTETPIQAGTCVGKSEDGHIESNNVHSNNKEYYDEGTAQERQGHNLASGFAKKKVEEQMAAKIMECVATPSIDEVDIDPKISYQLPSLASSTSGTSERLASPSLDSDCFSLTAEETFSKDSEDSKDVGILSDMFSEILKSTGEDPLIEAAKRLFGSQNAPSAKVATVGDPTIVSNETSSVFSVKSTNSLLSNESMSAANTNASEANLSAEPTSVLSSKMNQEAPKGILRPSSFHTVSESDSPQNVCDHQSGKSQQSKTNEQEISKNDTEAGSVLSATELETRKTKTETTQNSEKGLWKKSVARIFKRKGQSVADVDVPTSQTTTGEKKARGKKVAFTDRNEIRYHTSCYTEEREDKEAEGIMSEERQDDIGSIGCSAFPTFAMASSMEDDNMSFDSTDQSESWLNTFFGHEEPLSDSQSFD